MSRKIGQLAEQWACAYLQRQGLIWVRSNYLCPGGEIDLIMRDQDTVVFVEVRYRADLNFGESVETVAWRKQQRIIKAAWCYLLETNTVDQVNGRFDVLGLAPGEKIYWIKNAFEVEY